MGNEDDDELQMNNSAEFGLNYQRFAETKWFIQAFPNVIFSRYREVNLGLA